MAKNSKIEWTGSTCNPTTDIRFKFQIDCAYIAVTHNSR